MHTLIHNRWKCSFGLEILLSCGVIQFMGQVAIYVWMLSCFNGIYGNLDFKMGVYGNRWFGMVTYVILNRLNWILMNFNMQKGWESI